MGRFIATQEIERRRRIIYIDFCFSKGHDLMDCGGIMGDMALRRSCTRCVTRGGVRLITPVQELPHHDVQKVAKLLVLLSCGKLADELFSLGDVLAVALQASQFRHGTLELAARFRQFRLHLF